MKQEIERKFLVTGESWRAAAGEGVPCKQGYISTGGSAVTVRVRLMGGRGFLTIKGPASGISRCEMEYEIPPADAGYMLDHLCGNRIVSKMRYTFIEKGMRWEVDEFSGRNDGLVMAEIELESETQPFEKPDWIGAEVSLDGRFTNASLSEDPYCNWPV